MAEPGAQRRLTTIVAIDVAGYSARAEADQDGAADEVAALRAEIREVCDQYGGRLFNMAGDGFMLEFPAVTDAVSAAEALAETARPPIRVGVHLGEVRVADGGDLLGHGVNVAARIQALAAPRHVLVSDDVRRAIRGPLAARLADRGETRLDKMDEVVRLFELMSQAEPARVAPSAPKPSIHKLDRRSLIATGALGMAGAAGLAGYRLLTPRGAGNPLVAVLPFDNLSPDPQIGYLADGVAEDILNALVRGGRVRVTSRSSSFTFRGADKARAAKALGAQFLVDGSVLREGSRLKISAHLNDVARQETRWSEAYERDIREGSSIGEEIAGEVLGALHLPAASDGASKRPTIDPTAYDLYLKGRNATLEHELQSLTRGHEMLVQALQRAPDFAPAWFQLAKIDLRLAYLHPVEQQVAICAEADKAARRAITLDPSSGAPYGILSALLPLLNRWDESGDLLAKGLSVTPNDPDLLTQQGAFDCSAGTPHAAIDSLIRGQALNPLELYANHSLCIGLTFCGRFADAERIADRLDALWPGTLSTYWDRFWLLMAEGRLDRALAVLQKPDRPQDRSNQFDVMSQIVRAAMSGNATEVKAALAAALKLAAVSLGHAANMMILSARLGGTDQAVRLAESVFLNTGAVAIDRSIEFPGNSRYPLHGQTDAVDLFHPFLRDLRASGRLKPVFDGIGLTAYWAKSGPADV